MSGNRKSSWGGKRKGAGRKRGLVFSERRQIASAYFTRMRKVRDLELQNDSPRREAVIRNFRFIWRSTVRDMVLGHSKMSLAVARELATKARRMVTEGQNPIGGSWLSAALESVKSKS